MILYRSLIVAAAFVLASACSNVASKSLPAQQAQSVTVITPDEVSYQSLNPARGDAAPRAGMLWGDITKNVPSGVLLQFSDGFSSPPHIHNITYRAMVIKGAIHNDDPDAATMWMGPGAFWTQPAGELHITAAKPGVGGTGFLEILEGPYLVQPGDMAFDNGERPLNLVRSNMVWMSADELNWLETNDATPGPMATLLWGDLSPGALSGSLIKLPQGFKGALSTIGGDLKAVIISGEVAHTVHGVRDTTDIGAGGYFASAEDVAHELSCQTVRECLIYVRTDGRFSLR